MQQNNNLVRIGVDSNLKRLTELRKREREIEKVRVRAKRERVRENVGAHMVNEQFEMRSFL